MSKQFTARDLPYMEAAKEALLAGFEAFMTGQPMSANSHDPMNCPTAFDAWRAGWLQAASALECAGRTNRVA